MKDFLKEMGVTAEEADNYIVIYYGSQIDSKAMERMQAKIEEQRKRFRLNIIEVIDIK